MTPWTVAHQVLLTVEYSRQEYWNGLPFPCPYTLMSVMKRAILSKSKLLWLILQTSLESQEGDGLSCRHRHSLEMVNVPWVSCSRTLPFQTIEHSFPLTMEDDGGFLRQWKDIQHCAEEGWAEGQEERKGTFPGLDEWPGDRVFGSTKHEVVTVILSCASLHGLLLLATDGLIM